MKKIEKVYISGPISGHNQEKCRQLFGIASVLLEGLGFVPVNPMENGLPFDADTHDHMRRDFNLLLSCDAIFMMKGWLHSAGCKLEFDMATAIGLPVYFEEVWCESETKFIRFY